MRILSLDLPIGVPAFFLLEIEGAHGERLDLSRKRISTRRVFAAP